MEKYYCHSSVDLGNAIGIHRHSLYAAKVNHGDERIIAITTERGRELGGLLLVEAETDDGAINESEKAFGGFLGAIGLGHLEVITVSCNSKSDISAEMDLLMQGIDPANHTAKVFEI
jgi:hypothetical protein